MKSIKNRIKVSFNRAAETYDHYAQLQWQQSLILANQVKKILKADCNKIIDLGCGTGNSTLVLQQNFRYQNLYAIDIATALLKKAEKKLNHENLWLIESDFDCLPEKVLNIDLIFSNMALQWSPNLNITLALLSSKLCENGLLAFSLPLKGTFNEISLAYRNQFQSSNVIQNILASLNFELLEVNNKTVLESFTSPLAALRSLKMIGANCIIDHYQSHYFTRDRLKNIVGEHVDLQKNFQLTYKIGFFIARKRFIYE